MEREPIRDNAAEKLQQELAMRGQFYFKGFGMILSDLLAKEVAKNTAYSILKKRDSRIKMEHLEIETTPYVNFTTKPPSPAKGNIIYPLLNREGDAELIEVESSEVVEVNISTNFYNEFKVQGQGCAATNDKSKDTTCISSLHFVNGQVYMIFSNPC